MNTPDTIAGRLVEEIMDKIKEHLKKDAFPQENFHYNRVYEKIIKILNENLDIN